MANLVIGPMLRYVSESVATVWVETDAPCRVEVLGHRTDTVAYSHAAHRGGARPDLRLVSRDAPASRAVHAQSRRARAGHGRRRPGRLELRMRDQPPDDWPHMLLLLGDQVYADEVSPEAAKFIRARRDVRVAPGLEVEGFEEHARLYREAWSEPTLRWLLSTLPTAMIFDDHDTHDDWNTSAAWKAKMRTESWWPNRVSGALMTYWIYQHIGNLTPTALEREICSNCCTLDPTSCQPPIRTQ